jgi:hypothetical protein
MKRFSLTLLLELKGVWRGISWCERDSWRRCDGFVIFVIHECISVDARRFIARACSRVLVL